MPNILRFLFCVVLIYAGFALCGWVVLGPYHLKVQYSANFSSLLVITFATYWRLTICAHISVWNVGNDIGMPVLPRQWRRHVCHVSFPGHGVTSALVVHPHLSLLVHHSVHLCHLVALHRHHSRHLRDHQGEPFFYTVVHCVQKSLRNMGECAYRRSYDNVTFQFLLVVWWTIR